MSPKPLWLRYKAESPQDTPCTYWNEDTRDRWLGLENVGRTLIDGELVPALIDNGARVNTVTPAFVKKCGLVVGSIADLNKHQGRIPIGCSGGYFTEPIGYVMFWVQFPGIPSYDESQVALVIRDGSEFSRRVPVIIGTPTIDRVIRALKESELDTIPKEWQRARRGHEFANGSFVRSMNPTEPMPTNTNQNPLDLNEKVFLKNKCTIPGFESAVVRARIHRTMMMGYCLNVITQAPYVEDRANLLVGVYVIPTYSELRDGSWSVAMVLRNLTGKPVHLSAVRVIARVLAANVIPEGKPTPDLIKKLDEQDPGSAPPRLSIEERQWLLMQLLKQEGGLDELAWWTPELARKFEQMLMEYHDIFSLDKNEIGCTDAAEHVIELLDEEPFKEKFRRIAPPLLDEVWEHLQEMLDGSAICPSQSPWCNAVVLVWKKDGGLQFCIDFLRLNARTKKDSYPLPCMQETMESMFGARFFSTMDLKSGFWQVKMAEKSRQYTAFTVGSMGIFEFLWMLYRLCNAPATFQRLMQNCLGELNLTYALIYLDDVIVFSQTEEEHLTRLRAVFE